MRFLIAIVDTLMGIVQRNPITVLVVLILAVAAPALLKGIAMFFLYLVLGFIALAVVVMFVFRWRISQMRKQMGDQSGGTYSRSRSPFGDAPQAEEEGDVKIYRTTESHDKRVAKDVGDYVEFEETKEK